MCNDTDYCILYSDKCRNKYGRRRPYIVVGAFLVIFSMLMISNASTIGHALGDPVSGQEANECANIDPSHPPAPIKHVARPIAIAFFVIGFWILDISNNMMQGPCRALLADIAAPEQQYIGMALVSLWIGAGNVLG
jgi:solute carrier family 45, member 1/2/4